MSLLPPKNSVSTVASNTSHCQTNENPVEQVQMDKPTRTWQPLLLEYVIIGIDSDVHLHVYMQTDNKPHAY